MDWNWYLTDDYTIRICKNNQVYWEIDGCYDLTYSEMKKYVLEFILKNQHELINDNDE